MDQRDEKYIKMTTTPVQRLVCSFAVPSIISMMISGIYNLVDTFFVGRLDTQSTASLGVVFSYMGLIQACSFFFGQGSGTFISRALGARKSEEAEKMAATGFLSAVIFGAVIALLCSIWIEPILTLFGATATVLPYAIDYFKWILAGTPFIVGTFVLNNQMRYQGNASIAVWGILSGAIINIILDPIFIFALDMGVTGAGLATALSQFTGFCIMLRLSSLKGGIGVKLKKFSPSVAAYKEIVAGGLPSLARQGLMSVGTMVLNNFAGLYGDAALAAFSVVGRVMNLAFSAVIGFGQGFQPVSGFNYGAKLYGRIRKAIRFCITVSTAYCTILAAVGIIWAPQIITIFRAGDPEVIRIGAQVLRAQTIFFPLMGFVTISNMFLQSTRQMWSALFIAIARHGMFLIPALIIGSYFGLPGIIAAQPVSDILSFLIALPLCLRAIRRMK